MEQKRNFKLGHISFLLLLLITLFKYGNSIYLEGGKQNYARYPIWDACINASMSFDFKTGQSNDSLLMYMDDKGLSDFIQVKLKEQGVSLMMKVSHNPDIGKQVIVPGRFDDNLWHTVTITRNRMEVKLTVDGLSNSVFLEGNDFHLGDYISQNSYLYFGGMPSVFYGKFHQLSNPEIMMATKYKGYIRNVIYRNCTCLPVRAELIDGYGVREDTEKCKLSSNKCREGCVCISTDTDTGCDCSYREECSSGNDKAQNDIVYYLPMDSYTNNTLKNPSGLHATVSGGPRFIRGVLNRALVLRGHQWIRVAGPAHRQECFGDLDLCPNGYTISFWVKFLYPSYQKQVFLTNGGHRSDSHGIAMLYSFGVLEFIFRNKEGNEWKVLDKNVLPNQWYYIAASWSQKHGLDLVKNGLLSKRTRNPTKSQPANKSGLKYSEFMIGSTNDNTRDSDQGTIIMDEFKFWDRFMTVHELEQLGPIYHYYLNMDAKRGSSLDVAHMDASLHGNVWLSHDAVIGKSLHLSGPGQYVNLQHQGHSCLGNLARCLYGFMMSMWIKFVELNGKRYYVSTGLKGLTIYSDENTLYAVAKSKKKVWQVSLESLQTGLWYFLEVSFHQDYGLSMFLNQNIKKTQSQYSFKSSSKSKHGNMYIGKDNGDMTPENFPNAYIDEMEIYFADRDTLLYLDFIQRGRPYFDYFTFNQMIGNRIIHPSIMIETYGQPRLVPGKIGKAIQLDGNTEYVDINEHPNKCLGNLDECRHGFLMSAWIRLDHLKNNMAFFSTALNGITMDYIGGKIVFSLSTSSKMWTTKVDPQNLSPGQWQFLEITWHPHIGLKIYVNENLIASDLSDGTSAVKSQNFRYQHSQNRFYLGKGKDTSNRMVFGAVTFDNIRYWYGDRDYLLAHGYIQRGRPTNYIIDMEKIEGKRLIDESLYITVGGDPKVIPGYVGYAVNLNESNQYINLGSHLTSCLGNLEKCTNGIYISSWMKFGPYRNNMYYYSTGKGGISMYQREGYMYVNFLSGSNKWKIQIPSLKQDSWHFVELSWHPESGLDMYVNNKHVGHTEAIAYRGSQPQGKEFLIGRPNHGESKGSPSAPNFAIDELEIWYSTRDDLLASNYIVRDKNGQETFSMETNKHGIVENPHFTVNLVNGASLIEGYIGNAVSLNGIDQYVHIEPDGQDCIYNLDKCSNGLTASVWLNPRDLKGTKYFLSSPAYSLYTENGELRAKFHNGTRSWSVASPKFQTNKWQHVVLSWDPYRGLSMYIDKEKVDVDVTSEAYTPGDDPAGGGIYIGTDLSTRERYHANITVDELKYYRTSVNGITKGYGPFLTAEVPEKFYRFDRLLIPGITFYGSPDLSVGSYGKVLKLNGINQYGNLGLNITCAGNLENCVDGFVARVTIKPERLLDNMYVIDSYPLSLYYLEGRLYGKLRTTTKTWTVSTDQFKAGQWQNVELDWYPDIGLRMFINRKEVGHDTAPEPHRWHSTGSQTILGRSLSGSTDDRFFNGLVERVEMWRRRRSNQLPTISVPTVNTEDRNEWIWHVPSANKWLTLSGNSFYGFNLSAFKPDYLVRSANETFKFIFKNDPSQKEGLLWYTSNPDRNMFLILKNGNLYFISEGIDGRREKIAMNKPASIRFDDSTDHEVVLKREGSRVYWVVDGIYKKEFRIPSNIAFLDHRDYVYVGGTPDNIELTRGETNKNFKGIIRRVEYDTIRSHLDLISMSPSTSTGDTVVVVPTVTTRPVTIPPKPDDSVPVTFSTSESYLRTHSWDIRSRGGEIKFKFLTNDPHGLLLFNGDRKYFIALELFDGDLYVVYNFGSGIKRVKFSDEVVVDGKPHNVRVSIDPLQSYLELQIDSFRKRVDLSKDDRFVNPFPGDMYVGWVSQGLERRLPWSLFSSKGFRGCLIEFEVNRRQDILKADSGSNYGILQECRPTRHQCNTNTCKNGLCRDYWNRYICDCSNTPYTGPNCDKEAPIAVIDGQKYAYITFEETQATHVDDISLRFQTPLKNATLFHTSAKNSTDSLDVSLVNGEVVLVITVNGVTRRLRTGKHLNDQNWHTLYVRRRANQITMWVDDGAAVTKTIKSQNFDFNINKVDIAARPKDLSGKPRHNFIGYMQNFHYNNIDIFSKLKSDPKPVLVFIYGETSPALVYHAVTFPTQESYIEMPTLEAPTTLKLDLMFKTKESSGLLLYNGGSNNEFIALELQDGYLAMVYNMGSLPTSIYFQTPYKLNDNKWHYVSIDRVTPQRWNMKVDNSKVVSTQDKLETLDVDGPLYIGGAPKGVLKKGEVTKLRSTHGFQGCIASINLNGNIADIYSSTAKRLNVMEGCQNISMLCQATTCAHNGICIQKKNGFICDCSETTYTGTRCTEQTIGYYFGQKNLDGMIIYTYPIDKRLDSAEETISFGFMTHDKDGTITRVTSSVNKDFIEIKLVDGRLVATYMTGAQVHILTSVGNYSDGAYHTVKFHRTLTNSSLIVDGQPAVTSTHEGQIPSYFDKLTTVAIGARERTSTNDFINPFHGIIAGYYINNLRPFENTGRGNNLGISSGDAEVAIRPFTLGKSIPPIKPEFPDVETTAKPTESPVPLVTTPDGGGIIIPPSGSETPGALTGILVESDDDGGMGVAVDVPHFAPIRSGPSILGGAGNSDGVVAAAFASGATGGGAGAGAGAAGAAAGSRAGAAAGTFLALLTLGAGLTWAFVQCKPGMCSPLGGGGGGGGGGDSPSISSPGVTAPLIQQSAGGAGSGGGSKVQVANGSVGAAAGGSSSGFTFINTNSSYSGAAGSGQAGDSATLRVTGTFSNKGTAIGTPRQGRAVTAQSSGYSSQQNTLNVNSSNVGSGFTYMDGSSAAASGYGGGVTNYDTTTSNYNYDTSTFNRGGHVNAGSVSHQQFDNTMYSSLGADGRSNMQQDVFSHNTVDAVGYSSSTNTMSSSYNYQMKSYTARNESSSSYMNNYNASAMGGSPPALPGQVVIADGVRVDCCLMTSDGRSVVTGSSTGAPQVWDMQSGELLRAMQGNVAGASNLHLAYNGQLLVGSVNMDNHGVNEFSTKKGVTNRNLQIWDFDSGRPLVMPGEEYCSALQVMSDGDKVALGRTDKYGNSTSIIVWDMLGNQPIKEMRYEAAVGNNDYISFLNLSQNNRYAVAGFHNTMDGSAEFVVFDMTLTSYNVVEPSILKMNANPECTAILKNEAVTGLKNGDLVVWNLRNGQPLRQMLSTSGNHAHNAEVTAVALSEDSSTLVSASADSTIKVWDMSNESLINTLIGHTGVVSCVAISPDNEIIASGSQDGSIRLWRTQTGSQFCSFNTNMDVFFVTMSRDKGTIVALGDKFGARKLIMLQVVRSKVRRQVHT